MERLALAAFDIKPLQFSLEERKKKKEGRKKVVHHSVKMCGEYLSLFFFFLRQFQDLERKEINA